VAGALRAAVPRASWVRQGNFHLTLRFLGDVEGDRVREIGDALAAAAAAVNAFDLALRGLGAFPTAAQPRIVWVGASGDNLGALAAAVDGALERIGIPREARAFSGHVTLGRLRAERGAGPGRRGGPEGLPALARALGQGAAADVGRTRVSHIALMQSQLSPRGALYTELRAAPLGA
jgi:2'-5' RNA ligase